MTVSDFYSNQTVIDGFGKGRTYKVISQLRDVWPGLLGKENGMFPYYNKPMNNYLAAWIIFILSNCKSHSKDDVVKAIKRGQRLHRIDKNETKFIVWFGDLLSDPKAILRDIKHISIFFDADDFVNVETEESGKYQGYNLLFHGSGPAFKIRKAAVLEKDFLIEIAELIHQSMLIQSR